MKEFDIERIKGPIATMLTPFSKEGDHNDIDEEALRAETRFLAESEIAGLFPLATTSEFPFMSMETKRKYVRIVAEENKGRKALMVGACGVNYTETMQLIELAHEYEADAVVVCAPYYYHQTSDMLIRYYNAIAENPWGVKIVMYNIPACSSEIPMDAVEELVRNPNIVGIKDSSGNMQRIRQTVFLKGDRKDFVVYVGNDDIVLPALAAGAEGLMGVMSVLTPEITPIIFKAFKARDKELAQAAQESYLELCYYTDPALPFPAQWKMVLGLRGFEYGYIHQFYDRALEAEVKAKCSVLLEKTLKKAEELRA